MTTTIPSTEIAVSVEPLFSQAEQLALAGFLAGYRGRTRDAYALDLRMFTAWCQQHRLHLFQARRATSSASAATWTPAAVPGRRLRDGCAPFPGFIATRWRRSCLSTRPPCMCGVLG